MRLFRVWPAAIAGLLSLSAAALGAAPSGTSAAPYIPQPSQVTVPGALANGIPAGVPNSPALGVGLRLEREAFQAQAYQQILLRAGQPSPAQAQLNVATIRANQAMRQFTTVTSSATYGAGPAGAEALYHSAICETDVLGSYMNALAPLRTLSNNYSSVNYPDKPAAKALLAQVWPLVDQYYRTKGFWRYGYMLMDFLVSLTGKKTYSYWFAILLISALVKLILVPTSNKQFKSMKEMQKLQPLMSEIQTKYKDDPQKAQQKIWDLYKEHNVNPFASCSSIIWTLPIMYGLWALIRLYEFQFAKGTFLWIGSPISHLYPSVLATNLSQPDTILLLIYAGSMYFQMRLAPPPADPAQAEQQRMMAVLLPVIYTSTFLRLKLSSAFVLYYLIFNLLSMAQQWYFMRKRAADGPIVTGTMTPPPPASKTPERNGFDAGDVNANGKEPGRVGNGSKPASRGPISPKVHPKKKRR